MYQGPRHMQNSIKWRCFKKKKKKENVWKSTIVLFSTDALMWKTSNKCLRKNIYKQIRVHKTFAEYYIWNIFPLPHTQSLRCLQLASVALTLKGEINATIPTQRVWLFLSTFCSHHTEEWLHLSKTPCTIQPPISHCSATPIYEPVDQEWFSTKEIRQFRSVKNSSPVTSPLSE